MYTNTDIDRFLLEARKEKDRVLPEIGRFAHGQDANIIGYAIQSFDFVAEDFDRYDSDVCEKFLMLMEFVGIAE